MRLGSLRVDSGSYLFVDHGVQDAGVICRDRHCIKTRLKEYTGSYSGENQVTISVDFEAGVALSYATPETWPYLRNFWDSRSCVLRLAELFKKYRIPATWATCGHLFLDGCSGDHGFDERDWQGEWFSHDPCSDYETAPSWYMPDVIEELIKTPHFEIGYHTFGHFRLRHCSEATVRRDMELARQIRKKWGLKLESFVFPYNECGHFELLKEGGFTNFRGNIGKILPSYGIIDFGDFRFFNTTQMFAPETMDRCFRLLDGLDGRAANFYTHCYQWGERDAWQKLEQWLARLAGLRDAGKISLAKMGDLRPARPVESKPAVTVGEPCWNR